MKTINFFNSKLLSEYQHHKKQFLYIIILLFFLLLIPLYLQFSQLASYYSHKEEYFKLLNRIKNKEPDISSNQRNLEKQKLLKLEYDKIKSQTNTINNLLILISDIIPIDVSLSRVVFKERKELKLIGSSKNMQSLTNFIRSLSSKKNWSKISLESIVFNGSNKELNFSIKIGLNQ